MPYCPSCGARLSEDADSCPSCLASANIPNGRATKATTRETTSAPTILAPEEILFVAPVDTSPVRLGGPKRLILVLFVVAGLGVAFFSVLPALAFWVAAGIYYYIGRRSPNRGLRGMQYVLTDKEARIEDMKNHIAVKRCNLNAVVAIALNTGNRRGHSGRVGRAAAGYGDVLFLRGSRTVVRFDNVPGAQGIVDEVNSLKASS